MSTSGAKSKGGPSLVEIATNKIRDRILDLTLAPGSQLDEGVLRDKLNISRTPAREALSRLVAEGLVESSATRGFFVRQLDLHETAHFFNMYLLIDRSAASLCRFTHKNFVADMRAIQQQHAAAVASNRFLDITRHNAEFHTRIAAATENRFLLDFSVRIHNFARRLAYYVYAYESDNEHYFKDQQGKIINEHDMIIAAIEKGERDEVVDLITRHAVRLRRRIANFVEGNTFSDLYNITDLPPVTVEDFSPADPDVEETVE